MRDERALPAVFLVALAGCVIGWYFQVRDGYGFLAYMLLIFVASFAIYPYFARRAAGVLTVELYATALTAKLAASAARYWTITALYGRGDALRYDQAGSQIAEALNLREYSILDQWRIGSIAVDYIAGFCYTVLPQSIEGMFLLFSFLAFAGSLFFLLAFRAAFPEKPIDAYGSIVLFLPSILFWPSSLGKDAVVFLGLGLVAYGVARQWVQHAPHGVLCVAAGVAAVTMVRPHSAGLLVIAAGAAALWSLLGTTRGLAIRLVGGALVAVIGYYVLVVNADFLFGREIEELTAAEVTDLYAHRKLSTQAGGSAVALPGVAPALVPLFVLVTVLFRPFPWEVANPAMAVTALENAFMLWFFATRWRSLAGNLRLTRSNMLLALCLFFSVGVMAFQSGTSNLGIIARQRVQFLPYLFMLFL